MEQGPHRVVLERLGYHGTEEIAVHSSHDGGKHWRTEEMPYGEPRGIWLNPTERRIWQYVRRGGVNTIERIDANGTISVFPARSSWRPAQRCWSRRHWRLLHGELMVEGERDYIRLHRHDDLVACDDNGALVMSPGVLLRCLGTCQRVFTPPTSGAGAATLLPDGRWMYVATLEGIAATWIEGRAQPTFHRLPDPADEAVALDVIEGQPALLLGWDHNEIMRFPEPLADRALAASTQP